LIHRLQKWLMVGNPILTNLKILLILFNADVFTVRVHAGYGRGKTSGTVIKHRVAFIRVGADQVFKEGNGLLCGMKILRAVG
jgi:hypothetical protein